MKINWFCFLLLCSACTGPAPHVEILEAKCRFFDFTAFPILEGFAMHGLRGRYPHGSFQVNKIGAQYDYAVVRFLPRHEIEKNFNLSDTIDLAFVDMVAALECDAWFCNAGFSRMDLTVGDSSYVLFRGIPPKKLMLGGLNPAQAKPLEPDWRYFRFPK